MIEGAWAYVIPAYVVTLFGLGVLALTSFLRARAWARRARALEPRS